MAIQLDKYHDEVRRGLTSHQCSACRMILSVTLATAMVLASGATSHAAHAGQTVGKDAGPAAAASPAGNPSNVDARLRAAAEPFETLTETAFSAPEPELRKRLTKAGEALQSMRHLLNRQAADEVDDHFSVLKAAASKSERALMALASIEVYRILVSAVSSEAKVPNSVSLLDYAGFRYDADLKADPIRWSDMSEAARFAKQEWQMLAPRVDSPKLAEEVSAAVASMASAAQQKDESAAARSAKAELDLVDRLETHFSSRPAAAK